MLGKGRAMEGELTRQPVVPILVVPSLAGLLPNRLAKEEGDRFWKGLLDKRWGREPIVHLAFPSFRPPCSP